MGICLNTQKTLVQGIVDKDFFKMKYQVNIYTPGLYVYTFVYIYFCYLINKNFVTTSTAQMHLNCLSKSES